jgi:hypothetical protein
MKEDVSFDTNAIATLLFGRPEGGTISVGDVAGSQRSSQTEGEATDSQRISIEECAGCASKQKSRL